MAVHWTAIAKDQMEHTNNAVDGALNAVQLHVLHASSWYIIRFAINRLSLLRDQDLANSCYSAHLCVNYSKNAAKFHNTTQHKQPWEHMQWLTTLP